VQGDKFELEPRLTIGSYYNSTVKEAGSQRLKVSTILFRETGIPIRQHLQKCPVAYQPGVYSYKNPEIGIKIIYLAYINIKGKDLASFQ
jgi:hypothetical protein